MFASKTYSSLQLQVVNYQALFTKNTTALLWRGFLPVLLCGSLKNNLKKKKRPKGHSVTGGSHDKSDTAMLSMTRVVTRLWQLVSKIPKEMQVTFEDMPFEENGTLWFLKDPGLH